MRSPQESIADMVTQIQRIEKFTERGRDAFLATDETQYAVTMAYIILGEAAKNLADDLLEKYPEVNWRQIKGFRDFLIHSYHRVQPARIWEAVELLPTLKAVVEAMQNDLNQNESPKAE